MVDEREIEELLDVLDDINSDEEAAQLAGVLGDVHREAKRLDEERKAALKPLQTEQKQVNARFKPALDLLGRAKAAVKGVLEAWEERREQRYREAIRAAALGGDVDLAAPPPIPGLTYRTEVVVEVLDPLAVPREFLVVDTKALEKLAKAGKDAPDGVRFTTRKKIAVKA